MRDDLRPEYDLSQLKGGVRGKYYRRATAGTNLVLIEPELADVFPDTGSVNRALRLLVDTAEVLAVPTRRWQGEGLVRKQARDCLGDLVLAELRVDLVSVRAHIRPRVRQVLGAQGWIRPKQVRLART